MADKRINALANTAPSTASDDFIAVDGTTNGTRKLNAFSPTFGGNATVTGTLTVNGATGSLGSSASAATSLKLTVGVGTNASPKYRTIDFRNYDDSKSQAYIRAANRETDSNASTIEVAARSSGDVLTSIATFSDSQLSIAATTASTTTSTGALVVGNGTSGGLGVGGAINSGGAITAGVGTHSFGTSAGGGVNSFGSLLTYFNIRSTSDSDNPIFRVYDGRVNVSAFEVNARTQVVTLPGTTASTSTSSGALVVSGGVGVAGNVWTGGQVNLAATSVEASTGINFGVSNGASRDLVFFGDGTRGGMLRGYHDGSNIARLGFGFWASSGDTYTSVIDITGSATTSSQLVAIAGTASSTSTTSGALTVAGGMGVVGAVNAGTFYGLVDGVTAPGTESGYARIYVDSADGDLKVKFGDGTVKTIATDS